MLEVFEAFDAFDVQGFLIVGVGNLHSMWAGCPWMTLFTLVLGIMQGALIVRKWRRMDKADTKRDRREEDG